MSELNFKEDGFDSDVLTTLSDTQENKAYVLDLRLMRTAQLNDVSLI